MWVSSTLAWRSNRRRVGPPAEVSDVPFFVTTVAVHAPVVDWGANRSLGPPFGEDCTALRWSTEGSPESDTRVWSSVVDGSTGCAGAHDVRDLCVTDTCRVSRLYEGSTGPRSSYSVPEPAVPGFLGKVPAEGGGWSEGRQTRSCGPHGEKGP